MGNETSSLTTTDSVRINYNHRVGALQEQHHLENVPRHVRVERFAKSHEWKYFEEQVLAPLTAAVSSPESKLATLAMLMRGRRAILDYVTLYSSMPPPEVMSALMASHEALLLDQDSAADLFDGASMASVGDFMSVIVDKGAIDARILEKLSQANAIRRETRTTEKGATREKISFAEAPYSDLNAYPSVIKGLRELEVFYKRQLEGNVLESQDRPWTTADTLLVFLIVSSSIHWQERLKQCFGHRLTQGAIVSLAQSRLAVLNATTPDPAVVRHEALVRLLLLRILDTCVE